MDIVAQARRRAFSLWLRTGRLPRWLKPAASEVKFNPWHDPDDGRFTFAGSGRYFGRGGSRGAEARHSDDRRAGRGASAGGGRAGGGRGPSGGGGWGEKRPFGGFSNGDTGGAGASGSWGPAARPGAQPPPAAKPRTGRPGAASTAGRDGSAPPAPQPRRPERQGAGQAAPAAAGTESNWQRVERNGYEYRIDDTGRTRRVSGTLVLNEGQSRSRTAQIRAGGEDRRASDDGGHYIARRFNGPTEAYNHFAQDANFNRGRYRALEDKWAKALKASQPVKVSISPVYEGTSQRPSLIIVTYWIGGERSQREFTN